MLVPITSGQWVRAPKPTALGPGGVAHSNSKRADPPGSDPSQEGQLTSQDLRICKNCALSREWRHIE